MKDILNKIYQHSALTRQEAYDVMNQMAEKAYSEIQVAALLSALNMRAIEVDELLGFRQALVERAVKTDLSAYKPIDIVGTGGDGKNTFNISTTACFVVAGAGYKVAKHGNYGASSVSGASTVLQQHGVKFTNKQETLERSIETCGMAYLHAPLFHPALAAVGPVRRALGVKTVFNLLGPLVNPSHAAYQLLGVASLEQMRLYTQVLQRLGIGFTVVTSLDGYDEVSLTGTFKLTTGHYEKLCMPSDCKLQTVCASDIYGGNTPEEAAKIFDNVLNDTSLEAQKQCVMANAAVAIHTICPEKDFSACIEEARESIESKRALQCFMHFVEINQ